MLITNGIVTRNIADKRFPQYEAKGYKEVKPEDKPEDKPKGKNKGEDKPKE